jgi:hypothetical protein
MIKKKVQSKHQENNKFTKPKNVMSKLLKFDSGASEDDTME